MPECRSPAQKDFQWSPRFTVIPDPPGKLFGHGFPDRPLSRLVRKDRHCYDSRLPVEGILAECPIWGENGPSTAGILDFDERVCRHPAWPVLREMLRRARKRWSFAWVLLAFLSRRSTIAAKSAEIAVFRSPMRAAVINQIAQFVDAGFDPLFPGPEIGQESIRELMIG